MSRGRLFLSMTSLVFLVNLSRVVYAPLVRPLQDAFQADPGTIGLVVTMVWVGSALPRIPTGYLLTLVPRHYVVLGSGAVLTVAGVFAYTADSILHLGAGALLMGLASGTYFVSANPLLSELYPDRVGRVMGIHGMASQLAAVAAAPLVTVALLFDWRTVFAGIAVVAAAVTLLTFVVTRRTEMPAASGADQDLLGAVSSQWPIVLAGIVILGSVGFVWQGLFNFFPSYLVADKGYTEPVARNFLTVVFLAGVPAFLISGRLADRFPHVPYILVVVGAFVASVLAVRAAPHGLVLVGATAVLGYVVHSLFPALDTYLLDTLPDEHRGGAYAVYSGGMMLTQATGSSVVGALVDAEVPYAAIFGAFAAGLGVVLVALALVWASGRFPGARKTPVF